MTTNATRGRSVRRAIMAVATACAQRGLPLPFNAQIGAALGIDASVVCRHMNRMMDEGAFNVRREGRRVFVEIA